MQSMAEASDSELWRRAGEGEEECFGVLFDRYADAVRAYCAHRTGSFDTADDLVSVVFLEAWRRRRDIELVGDVALPWLYGIARLTMRHRWRSSVRHRRALARLPRATDVSDHAEEVARRVDDERQLASLRLAFGKLRPADQDVLALCVGQGLDYAAAAIALGVPIGTVRSRLSRARARLEAATAALTATAPITTAILKESR
jgi:RNA polymerase sigma factor (sigma-70 family)